MLEQVQFRTDKTGSDLHTTHLLVGQRQISETTLAAAMLANVHAQGDAAAIECGDQRLSWADLGARSGAVAAYLRAQGVGAGDRVLLMGPRSADMISCILGIWRAGAAYVPLDARTTTGRVQRICDEVQPAFALLGDPDIRVSVQHCYFDAARIDGWMHEHTASVVDGLPDGEDEAYVIFTSGSTGTPLGVPILHRQLASSTAARVDVYGSAPERFLLLSDIGFDSSIVGLFWTLSTGGCVVIPEQGQHNQIDALADLLTRHDISHCLCVPSVYGAILKQADRKGAVTAWPEQMIVAGDHCPNWVIRKHFETAPEGSGLANEFGPTEATVWASVTHYHKDVDNPGVGVPVNNVWIAVVDDQGAPLEHGQAGNLVVGGPNITKGYVNGTEATDTRFGSLPEAFNPFGDGERRYFRTGDRAVVRQGQVVLLGRADGEMNIQGQRVDGIEIERLATAHPGISNAVATAIDPRPLAEILSDAPPETVARASEKASEQPQPEFVLRRELAVLSADLQELALIVQSDLQPDFKSLASHIKAELGAALCPSRFAWMPEFPTTQNHKVDRPATVAHALGDLTRSGIDTPEQPPAQAPQAADTGQGMGEAPLTQEALTDLILEIFRTELRRSELTAQQSFFDHGGHSLKALNVVLEIEAATDYHVSTALIYENPTAEQLSSALGGFDAEAPEGDDAGDATHEPETPDTALVAIGDELIAARPLPVAGGFRTLTIPLRSTGDRPPIFAIHNIGDNASNFSEVARALSEDQPFYCLGKPIVFGMTKKFDDMLEGEMNVEEIATVYADEIERIVPEGPFVLSSLCGGVPFGHATALELKRRGRMPSLHVMFADWHAPKLKLAEDSVLNQIWRNRWSQIKHERLNLLWTLPKRAPPYLRVRYGMVVREVEKLMVRYAEKRGKPLSVRLANRKATEESLEHLHSFEHLPFDGPSVSIRGSKDLNFKLTGKEQGWGGVLSDWTYRKVHGRSFDLVNGVGAHESAALITGMIDRIIQGLHPFEAEPSAGQDAHQGADMGQYRIETTDYVAALSLQHEDAVPTPRLDQRNWLLNRSLTELSEEIDDLIGRAPDMIGGGGMADIDNRISAELAPEEIMEDWQIPLMQAMADAVAGQGGDILEVGYGRGISAEMVQAFKPNSHWIVECNQHVIDDCKRWMATRKDADIRIVEGLWQDTVDDLGQFDGILFHTYPLSLEELAENLSKHCTFAESFFASAKRLLKPGGRFTYFSNERDSLSRRHQRVLLDHFDSFTLSRVRDLNIPEDSRDAHWFQDIVCVTATARK